jgi:hypothetical protein
VVARLRAGEVRAAAHLVDRGLAVDGEADALARVAAGGAGDDERPRAHRGDIARDAFAE